MRVLLVDDDKIISSFVQGALKQRGDVVDYRQDGKSGLRLAQINKGEYDVIILDVLLPEMDGLKVCSKLRESGDNTPILMLSGRDQLENKVEGLEAGADDYLTKPFEVEELYARLKALKRRAQGSSFSEDNLIYKNIKIDKAAHEVFVDEKLVELTQIEFRMLSLLIENVGKVVTRNQLISKVWDMHGDELFSNTINVHIKNLRKKIGDKINSKPIIKTVRGAGYKLMPEK